jgi:tetratricopeptide (TPR) repeat protein
MPTPSAMNTAVSGGKLISNTSLLHMKNTKTAKVFISYSHKAENRDDSPKWTERLLKHLDVFSKHDLLDVWHDKHIPGGSAWEHEIEQAIQNSGIAVVLLTKEALESKFIRERELVLLRRRHEQEGFNVIPILCEPCPWKEHEWLPQVQIHPFEAKPLSELPEADADRVLRDLATEIAEQLSGLALAKLPEPDQPLPSDRIYRMKLPDTRAVQLIGRAQETALLNLAFAHPQTAILSLVASGGVGKTALVQRWLNRIQHKQWFHAQRVYAWSFYSQGTREDRQASEDPFLAHALEWFGVKCDPGTSSWNKGQLLADTVSREPTLLILDGVEPLQYPPTAPMSGLLRAPGVQTLLRRLATTGQPGLCVVTTRDSVTDLLDYERHADAAWGSALRVDIGNLTYEAGAQLLYETGACRAGATDILPDDPELLAASREVNGHALTLNLLGTFLGRAYQGDIRRRDLVKFDKADAEVQGGHAFKMLGAYERWLNGPRGFSAYVRRLFSKEARAEYQQGQRQLAVLRMLGLFDRPADVDCLIALRRDPAIPGLTEPVVVLKNDEEWNLVVSKLAKVNLVTVAEESAIDAHPLIREYFTKQLCEGNPEAWRTAHQRLYEHFRSTTPEFPDVLEGLLPLYRAVAHGCSAGLHPEALEQVFRRRIHRSSMQKEPFSKGLGAFGEEVAALRGFIEKPWHRAVSNLSETDQGFVLFEVGYALRALGYTLLNVAEATAASLEIAVKLEEWQEAAFRAGELSQIRLLQGEISQADAASRDAVNYVNHLDDQGERARRYAQRATVLHHMGNWSESESLFNEAEILEKQFLGKYRGFTYCMLLLDHGRVDDVVKRASEALKMEETKRNGWSLDIGLAQVSLGRAFMLRNDLNRAKPLLESALDNLRKSGRRDHVSFGLLALAELRSVTRDFADARSHLDEAWQIARLDPMQLFMADIHLHRAHLFHAVKPYPWNKDRQGNPRSPKDDLTAAHSLIERCGYWRRKKELEDAEEAAQFW